MYLKKCLNSVGFFLLVLSVLAPSCKTKQEEVKARIIEDFNFDWQFSTSLEEDEASLSTRIWQEVRLPHDWNAGHAHGSHTLRSDSLPEGVIGWYKKEFTLPESSGSKQVRLEFDGVYDDCSVWLNGEKIGERPYGYIPFSFDLTPYLKFGAAANTVEVKVDRRAYLDCRWYSGSGIYRKVRLVTSNLVSIPQWGVFVQSSAISQESAQVNIEVQVDNRSQEDQNVIIQNAIIDSKGKKVGKTTTEATLASSDQARKTVSISVSSPELWSPSSPTLYTLETTVQLENGTMIDKVRTPFGIRSIRFDTDKGFFLNDKNTELKGVCLHHDGGVVGAAVPDDVWARRLKTLKAAGVNAIRTAHNPPSESFLNLCDQLGFLVQDEAFDEFTNPKDKRLNYNQQKEEEISKGYTHRFLEWSERDVKDMVLRDRNHPAVIMWSIGNEIEWTYPNYGASTGYWGSNKVGDVNYYYDEPPLSQDQIKENFYAKDTGNISLATVANNLSRWIKEVDTSRPVTANLVIPSVSSFSGYTDALDIIGYSYRNVVYDYGHKLYPEKMIYGAENWVQWIEWREAANRPFIPGIFVWTGINYLGEARGEMKRGSGSGMLDFAGFPKARYQMMKTLWSDQPHIYVATVPLDQSVYKIEEGKVVDKEPEAWKRRKWGWQKYNDHWNYEEKEEIVVEVFVNTPAVELYLNEQSLGVKNLEEFEDHILKWIVPFQAGNIRAVGITDQESVAYQINTAQSPTTIILTTDRKELTADGYSVAHITAQLIDQEGNPVRHQEQEIMFDVMGDTRILGTDNGTGEVRPDYQAMHCKTHQGRVMLLLQANKSTGQTQVIARSQDTESQILEISTVR